ncbi:MAG: hypothetical protein SNJ75_10935 [Gemmataceae bacterium]
MISLFREPWYRFHFTEDRLVPRFHLEGVPTGIRVRVYQLVQDEPGPLIAEGVVGADGWVECLPALRVQRGEGFLAVPSWER